MPLKPSEIATAASRLTFDLDAELKKLKARQPKDLNTAAQIEDRRKFLAEALPTVGEAREFFERILAGNELQPASYLERGAIAARSVCRIDVRSSPSQTIAWGTGFLIAPQVLITNNHVISAANLATHSRAQFRYELDLNDRPQPSIDFQLDPGSLFHTDRALDFTVIGVRPTSLTGNVPLGQFGQLPLLDDAGKALEGEWLTIVQHPSGGLKQLCVRENQLIKRTNDVLWYSTDTLGGSSGSPVFNNDWYVVALHHSGVPERVGDKIRGLDGRLYDPDDIREENVKWIANEGVRSSRIASTLRQRLPNHPLLAPMFRVTPQTARIGLQSIVLRPNPTAPPTPIFDRGTAMNSGNYSSPVTLQISCDGGGNVQIDCNGQPSGGSQEGTASSYGNSYASTSYERSSSAVALMAAPAFVFDNDYSAGGNRQGYDPDFLGQDGNGNQISVLLPEMSASLAAKATPLLPAFGGGNELKYFNYSVVMHSVRKFAIFTAANVSAGNRYDMSRPGDDWKLDPRIPASKQVANSYYASNKFDRGHLTRREDLEFGTTAKKALQSAADTCHWTNCTPQHSGFNQSKQIWHGIERHILEDAIQSDHLNAQVITGPVFRNNDPLYRNLRYPVRYWKVVAAINSEDELVATAFVASQKKVIDQQGLERVDPFGPFKNFQVEISEVERLTGLTFFYTAGAGARISLTDVDPFVDLSDELQPGAGPNEAVRTSIDGYREIHSLDNIVI